MLSPLYFDARYIRVGHHDGISRFSTGLLNALAGRIEVVAIICDKRQLEKMPPDIRYVVLNDPTNAVKEFLIARRLNKLGAKLVFSPMQTMGTSFRKFKVILTLHDLIYYAHPTPPPSFGPLVKIGWRIFHLSYFPQRMLLNKADAVVTVSETTKSLMQRKRLTNKPISVVYNAGSNTGHASRSKLKPASKSLIYMGSFMDYKNVETLIRGVNLLPDFRLHLLSRIEPKRQLELVALAKNPDQLVFHNGVSDTEYGQLLDEAFALVSASKDEGFGIPVIEAMERGTPAVISDIAIFREIGSNAAKYFDSSKPDDFAKQIQDLSDNWLSASKLSAVQAQNFTWEKSADQLIEVLRSVS